MANIRDEKLSSESFRRAAAFLRSHARPLEAARFGYLFGNEARSSVLDELVAYQNEDGGFGRALEPDFRAPESSALCTSIAFQVIRSLGDSAGEECVRRGLRYLAETLDRSSLHWRIIPRSGDFSPHAPWWNQAGREAEFDAFSLNPTAEILGYLVDHPDSALPEGVITQITDRVIATLGALERIEMHELMCCLRLLETKKLDEPIRATIFAEVKRLISGTVAETVEEWQGYSLRPLQVVNSPDSPFLAGLEDAVSRNLDYEIETQQDDGSWAPTWSWGDSYPDVWSRARTEWAGILTLDKLVLLRCFHRIEFGGKG